MIFVEILELAVDDSYAADKKFYEQIANALGWTGDFGPFGTIVLKNLTIPLKYKVSGREIKTIDAAVEYALRLRMPDDDIANPKIIEKNRSVDLKYRGVEIEVTIKDNVHQKVKVDSRGLVSSAGKWYLYIMGPGNYGITRNYRAWLVRADALASHINKSGRSSKRQTIPIPSNSSIGSVVDQTITDIEEEINSIRNHLARSIFLKSGGDLKNASGPTGKQQNTLPKLIGNSSVRFDIKFESTIRNMRKLIRENLREG